MSNYIEDFKILKIKELLKEGYGLRMIAQQLSIAKHTVARYRNIFLKTEHLLCKCGKPVGHQGWCRARYNLSLRRQEFMENWHEVKA